MRQSLKNLIGSVGAAFQLCTTETTVKIQRHQVMEKMGAGSLAELARMAGRLKAPVPK